MKNSKLALYAAGACLLSAATIYAIKSHQKVEEPLHHSDEVVVLLGDVGGTNIRLTLRRLNLKSRSSVEVKPFTKFLSQEMESIESTISLFLKDVISVDYPKIGVIGIAGAVVNNTVHTTNVPHWTLQDGFSIG